MSEPLALVLGQRGVIGTQLSQRLEALRYRVKVIANPAELAAIAGQEHAMIALVDVEGFAPDVLAAVSELHSAATTAHIPIIAFARELDDATQAQLTARGAAIAVTEAAVLEHLPQLLNRALEIP